MTPDEEAIELYRQRDRNKVAALAANRYRDQMRWRKKLREAEQIHYQRQFRGMWDGCVGVVADIGWVDTKQTP